MLRKGLRKWVGRAGVRRGLRKQVFTSAIKGKDVLRLMAMADEADTDDLSNAIMAKDAEGSTPMLIAAKRGHLDVVEMLITSMARCGEELHDASLLRLVLSTADAQGNSCLHWAARKGHLDVARSLLEAGSNVDAKNLEEATPLHWAARKNNVELMQILLSVGCDTTIQNKWGATAIEQAAGFGQQEAVQLIQQTEIKRQSSPNKRSKQQQRGGGGGASGGASGKAAASSGVSPPSMPKQPAWGEGPGMSAFVRSRQPPKIREQLERRREAAEKRRQEAYNMRIEQSRQAAADQLIRRKRQQLEIDMKELMEKIDGPITKYEASYISKAGPAHRGRSASRSFSPPKASVTSALGHLLAEANEIGVAASLIKQVEAKIKLAEEMRQAMRQAKLEASEGGEAEREGRSPMKKKMKLPGEKDPDAEMAKMQKKMAKKLR